MSQNYNPDVSLDDFRNFTDGISCSVFPVTHDRKVYLDEKVVSKEDCCVTIGKKLYEVGETYYDVLTVKADSMAELSDVVLRELYARGFATNSFSITEHNIVHLEYSFINDSPWIARRQMEIVVHGDITDENDHRRNSNRSGKWFTYTEVITLIGANRAHKIFERMSNV